VPGGVQGREQVNVELRWDGWKDLPGGGIGYPVTEEAQFMNKYSWGRDMSHYAPGITRLGRSIVLDIYYIALIFWRGRTRVPRSQRLYAVLYQYVAKLTSHSSS
jgi:hypothetical protein